MTAEEGKGTTSGEVRHDKAWKAPSGMLVHRQEERVKGGEVDEGGGVHFTGRVLTSVQTYILVHQSTKVPEHRLHHSSLI